MSENVQTQPERIVELKHNDPVITTRIKRSKKRSTPPAEDARISLLKSERDTAWREIEGHIAKINVLEEELAAAKWSVEQYRRDNELKANLLSSYMGNGFDNLAPLRAVLNTGGVVMNHVESNVTGPLREVKAQRVVIQHLLKALVELTA